MINLDDIILPHFRKLFKALMNNKFFRVVLKGGRSSGKSQFIAIAIVIGVMIHKRSAMALVRTKNSVTLRLDTLFIKALNILGVQKHWRYTGNNHTFILLDKNGNDTSVCIYCSGCDDPEKLKGVQPKSGAFIYLWIEEATNFENIKMIKNIESSIGRGDILHFTSIISYNPRQNTGHFLNEEYEQIDTLDNMIEHNEDEETHYNEVISKTIIDGDEQYDALELLQCVVHSTYKSLIKHGHRDWISPTDLVDIKYGEENNTEYYRWYYLGEVCGMDDVNVFRNIADWAYSDNNIGEIDRGLDCSNGGHDPWAWGSWYYDREHNDLYSLNEFSLGGSATIEDVAMNIRKINPNNFGYYIDSAVPTFGKQLCSCGTNANPVKKGADSVKAGIFWLKSLNHIYIDKNKCPITYKEFKGYEYVIDKNEEITTELKDKDNHMIDACRYAMSIKIRNSFYVRKQLYN